MSKIFKVRFLPLAAVKLPLLPFLRVETRAERSQQASAVAADGFNARPVLIDDDAIVVDGAATYCALRENGIDRVKVMLVGGASEKELRELRRALGVLPDLNAYVDGLTAGFESLLDAGYPIHTFIAGVVEGLEAMLESHGLPDAAALSEAWES
jgi:hypothetical protein